jgi:hypothetical protein
MSDTRYSAGACTVRGRAADTQGKAVCVTQFFHFFPKDSKCPGNIARIELFQKREAQLVRSAFGTHFAKKLRKKEKAAVCGMAS